MKTKIISLNADFKEQLYQLGLSEKESFLRIEERVTHLLSTNSLIRHGREILNRASTRLRKRNQEETFFHSCVQAYAEGLGIDLTRYLSFLSLFELAGHYGEKFPELKALIPGCTSLLLDSNEGIQHARLVDFPLTGILDLNPRLYLWQIEGKPTVLSFSCEGLAPVIFQAVHSSGTSFALHHKPSRNFHKEGSSIFQLTFELLFECQTFADFRRELKKKESQSKWSVILLEKTGRVEVYDIEGPILEQESYHLKETSPLLFTNIPLKQDSDVHQNYIDFCRSRQNWLKDKLKRKNKQPLLDVLTDVSDQKIEKWQHPAATLATTGAIKINLTLGTVEIKEGDGALVASDAIVQFSLADQNQHSELKAPGNFSDFELAWKKASWAQSFYDQGKFDEAYHQLQMAKALIPHGLWKNVFAFYLCVWDLRFVKNSKELSHVYKRAQKLTLPPPLKDQGLLLIMRLERRLKLQSSVREDELSPSLLPLFHQEIEASEVKFNAWVKLLYPRMEILDVFSPRLG